MSIVDEFLSKVRSVHKTGKATEPSYRSAIEGLFAGLGGVTALNEPKRVACGAPDFIIQKGEIAIGHVEAKDLGVNLQNMSEVNEAQKKRYLGALPNLIYTNCLEWVFYRDGAFIASVKIADLGKGVKSFPDEFSGLENLLQDFIAQSPQTITLPKELAEMMAGKAVLIKDVLQNALKADEDSKTELANQHKAFKEHLIHDITAEEFSDIYAETVAYGMFGARLHDNSLETFTRQKALELLPKSNPFLRNLFSYIAGPDLDERIKWIIDDLALVFEAANVAGIMEGFGKFTGKNDPFLHFYETFLAAYNPEKRRARGVWYTPEPVVNFIVRAVDDVLRAEFGIADGLADTSKVTIKWDTGQKNKKDKPIIHEKDAHRVQILDPAAGTGTFLAEVIKQIAPTVKSAAEGAWSNYVEEDLIPRLHGFELLMAPYAMCHTKLDMILKEMGYQPSGEPPRLSVYLTNSLEEGEVANQTLPFAQWLSNEVKKANEIKRDMPIMCVIGNPPYNPSSKNNSKWILEQLLQYKNGLGEKKINLHDDYMKFIRFAEYLIEKNNSGVVGMITNNSFLDGTTQRVMRKHLRETFDAIYVLNLHGDIRNETTDAADENVFDITQGVAISVMFCRGAINRKKLGEVYYRDCLGSREEKYAELGGAVISDDSFALIDAEKPLYRFLPDTDSLLSKYEEGFKISDLFVSYSSGIQTKRDSVCVSFEKKNLRKTILDFKTLSVGEIRKNYKLPKDGRDWTIAGAKKDVMSESGTIVPFLYKPFDKRVIYYSGKTKGFVGYPRRDIMRHLVAQENFALIVNRQTAKDYFSFAGVTDIACCHGTFYLGNRGQDYCMPLYTYPDNGDFEEERRANFDPAIFKRLKKIGTRKGRPSPDEANVFDYVYGVLHCPEYRSRFSAHLKRDFPKICWPHSAKEFWDVTQKGNKLRRLHLMDESAVGKTDFPFSGKGDSVVVQPLFSGKKVWINKNQYFDKVPVKAWEQVIGGYQPAEKWLQARKGRKLSFEDIKEYQRIIKALAETHRIMGTISLSFE